MLNWTGRSINSYHILEQLGQGGMAVVYKAFDTRSERDVAFKIIRSESFAPDVISRIQHRFKREVQTLMRLSHPNIVQILDSGEYEGSPYMVMPLLPGGTLKQKLGSPMPYPQAAGILLPIAQALAHAHQNSVIHRDVKPSNILFTADGQPMLTDFGVVKIIENTESQTLTGTGVGIGTPEYMAPEQGMGKEVDGRSDIYALGVVFYELVTGRKPFTADTPMAVVIKHVHDPLPSASQYAPGLPVEIEHVLNKTLAKKAEQRYPDMEGFLETLHALSIGQLPLTSLQDASLTVDMPPSLATVLQPMHDPQATTSVLPARTAVPTYHHAPTPSQASAAAAKPTWIQRNWFFLLIGALMLVGIILLSGGNEKSSPVSVNENAPSTSSETSAEVAQTSPLQGSSSGVSLPPLPADAIQESNVKQIQEVYSWKDPTWWITWIPDTHKFIYKGDSGLTIYDLDTGNQQNYMENEWKNSVSFAISPDGSKIASAIVLPESQREPYNTIRIWDFQSKQVLFDISGTNVDYSTPPAFSMDSRLIALIIDESVRVYDASNGSLKGTLTTGLPSNTSYWLTFSPVSNILAVSLGSTGEIQLWDADDMTLLHSLHWHEYVSRVEFSPDGRQLASMSRFDAGNYQLVRFWNVSTGELSHRITINNEMITSIGYNKDGTLLLTGSNKAIRVFRASDGAFLHALSLHGYEINHVLISTDGKYLLTLSQSGKVWGIDD